MAAPRVDIALIGAGCAGLSLALRLAQGGYGGRVLLVEPSTEDTNDRTWCGWSDGDHPFAAARVRRWWHWAVSTPAAEARCASRDLPYEMLDARQVRRIGWEAVARRDDWISRRGCRVQALQGLRRGMQVTLDNGEVFEAAWVLDSRAPGRRLGRPWLWQAFAGVELAGTPALDPETARLMDFRTAEAPHLLTFTYQLPIAGERRLLELTHFTPEPPAPAALDASLQTLRARLGLDGSHPLRYERGYLPMAPPLPQPGGRHIRIGAAGGSLRPATGYAFHAIQRWADACASRLLAGRAPCPPERSRLLEWMDRVFLEALWRDPRLAPERFLQLFATAPSESLARFLTGRPRPADLARVITALPTPPLLGAALGTRPGNRRWA